MKIGILGSGNVGSRWAKAGHQVVFGTRGPQGRSPNRFSPLRLHGFFEEGENGAELGVVVGTNDR